LYSRKSKSPGLAAVPVCVRKMLIISTDALVQEREREKEKERKRKQRDSENGRGGRGIIGGGGGRGGGGEGGGEGRGMSGLVRGRGGVQFSRQFSSIRSIGDELVVTRTGLADTSRRIVAPRIMFYSRQVLTLMRSRLSQYEHEKSGRSSSNISAQRKIFPMSSNEDSFPESHFTVEFRRILEDFHPDGMTLSDEAKEESCELFDIWKNEYFQACGTRNSNHHNNNISNSNNDNDDNSNNNIQMETVTERERERETATISGTGERMINFKCFDDWFSHDYVAATRSNLLDRIYDSLVRSPVLTVKGKYNYKDKDVEEEEEEGKDREEEAEGEEEGETVQCTNNAVSWFASLPPSPSSSAPASPSHPSIYPPSPPHPPSHSHPHSYSHLFLHSSAERGRERGRGSERTLDSISEDE
jgi:hypothetical protein